MYMTEQLLFVHFVQLLHDLHQLNACIVSGELRNHAVSNTNESCLDSIHLQQLEIRI